jgi:hypothetical protein
MDQKSEIGRELTCFIQDFNVLQRQLALYPAGHSQLETCCNNVVQSLQKSCRTHTSISLGIAPNNILFNGSWLDSDNVAIKKFSNFLSSLNIASISFQCDLNHMELMDCCQLLNSLTKNTAKASELRQLLERHTIKKIKIEPIDFSAFQGNDQKDSSDPWGDFLSQLLDNQQTNAGPNNLALIAQTLNQKSPNPSHYDQLITALTSENKTLHRGHAEISKQLTELINQLNPLQKQCFLQRALHSFELQPQFAEPILQSFPQQCLEDALRQLGNTQGNISSRLVDLLSQLRSNDKESKITAIALEKTDETILKAKIDILLLEDNHDQYVPSSYQAALQRILNNQIKASIPAELTQSLRIKLEQQTVELQYTNIIFNMLQNGVDAEGEATIQRSLTELARFFLDTGAFAALRDIFIRWSRYLYSGRAHARFLDETVLAIQTSDQFMNDVLDCVELWGLAKKKSIGHYILEVGEPYAELLIERLGQEKNIARQKIWMELLKNLGPKGIQLISQTLQDTRWHLVRSMLQILEHQKQDLIPIKKIRPLTQHKHPKVRQEALRIIFRFDPLMANRQLLKELSCGDKASICAALEIAYLSEDEKILNRLHQLLQLTPEHDRDLLIRRKTLDALSSIGKPQTIPILASLLHKKLILRRNQKQLQLDIIKTLGCYPAHSVAPLLNSLCKGHDRAQRALAKEQLRLLHSKGET